MNKTLWVIWQHDLMKWVGMRSKIVKRVVGRGGDCDRALSAAALKAKDNVFLQHTIILERSIS